MYLLYSRAHRRLRDRRVALARSTRRSATASTSAACAQRLGYLPVSFNLDGEASIWIHAVSVGEAAHRPAAHRRRCANALPALRLFLSTTTMSGQQLARRSLPDVDAVFYFPFDWTFIVRRTLDLVQAAAVRDDGDRDLAEPAARVPRAAAIKTIVVNGRISSRSFPRYRLVAAVLPPRAGRHRSLLRAGRRIGAPLHRARRRPDAHHGDRQPEVRFARAGGDGARRGRASACCASSGSPPNRPVLVAGSTMKGEEAAVLRAFRAA